MHTPIPVSHPDDCAFPGIALSTPSAQGVVQDIEQGLEAWEGTLCERLEQYVDDTQLVHCSGPEPMDALAQACGIDPLERYVGALLARERVRIVSLPTHADFVQRIESHFGMPLQVQSARGLLPLMCACAYWQALDAGVYLSGISITPSLQSLCGFELVLNARWQSTSLGRWIPFLAPALRYLTEAHHKDPQGMHCVSIPDLLCAEHITMMRRMDAHVRATDRFHHAVGCPLPERKECV